MTFTQSHNRTIIGEDDYSLLTLPSGGLKIVQLRRGNVINLGKFGQFSVDCTFGYHYGQSFEILDNKMLKPIKSLSYGLDESNNSLKSSETNQDLRDKGHEVQKLTLEDVEEMKKQGGGNDVANKIIEKMIENHGSFDKKTVYSQEKYLTRKQKKFTRRFTLNYLTSSGLLNFIYSEKDPQKILNLSEETLGLMMSSGNIMPGGDYLVLDETGGLIIYALLERMQGKGSITLIHENDQPRLPLLSQTCYSEEELERMIQPVNILQFLEPELQRPSIEKLTELEIKNLPGPKRPQYLRKLKKAEMLNIALDRIEANSFDSLIYVSTLNPSTFIPRIIPRLLGSRPIIIYNQYKEVLITLNHVLLKDKRILLPNIHQTTVRRYQTIPGKIHPLMTSRPSGGYILTGITVFPKEGIVAVGRGIKKRKVETAEGESELKVEEELNEVS